MEKEALELYLYMGSIEPIIEWLKEEGCKTQNQVKKKLTPLVESNILEVASNIGSGRYGSSLAGTANAVEKIIKQFEK